MEEELKKLLEENLVYSKEIYKCARSTRRMLMFDQILSVVKIVIIVIPLIFGFLYLTPYLKQITGMYSELLGTSSMNINDFNKMLKP